VGNIKKKSIILFDGVCNLCNTMVNFVLKRDLKNQFLFTSLRSDIAAKILKKHQLQNIYFDSIVLLENGVVYTKSTAALRIAKQLSGCVKLVGILNIFPKKIRDFLYDFIAKNRYKWFGKNNVCLVPSEKNKNKFLN